MRLGMGIGGSLLLAVSGLMVGGDASAVETGVIASGRILMQVPTGVEHEFRLAIGDVATGEVIPVGKPALEAMGGYSSVRFEGDVVVSGFGLDPSIVEPDGSLAEFVLEGGLRDKPTSLGDGEHYRVEDGIYAVSSGEFRPLASFSSDFGEWGVYLEELVGDWLKISNENATVYTRLSDLDTVRTLPASASHSATLLSADGLAMWEEDREGSSALMIADLAAPGPMEVTAREFYSASPFVNLRARVGEFVVAGRTELLLLDVATGQPVRNLTVDFDLPRRSTVYSLGGGPLLELHPEGGTPQLWNVETDELVPFGRGNVVASTETWALWEAADEPLMHVIDPAVGIVGDVELDALYGMEDDFLAPVIVGDQVIFPGCFSWLSMRVDIPTATGWAMSPMCDVVASDDGSFVAGSTTWQPDDFNGGCSTPMLIEEVGVGVVQEFPSGCPLAWLEQP